MNGWVQIRREGKGRKGREGKGRESPERTGREGWEGIES